MSRKKFGKDFRLFFFRGLAAILPTVLTVALIVWVFSRIQTYFGDYINQGAAYLTTKILVWQSDMTDADAVSRLAGRVLDFWQKYLFWFGFLLAVVAVYIFGRFLASFFGRIFFRAIERTLTQLPVVKQIYPSIKQVTDFLLAERKMEYSKVVAVQYPRKGIWSIGLVTNSGMRSVEEAVEENLLTIFVPSSPTPITGYTITVARKDVIDLPISIDEALRFSISGGVILPSGQQTRELEMRPVESDTQKTQNNKETLE